MKHKLLICLALSWASPALAQHEQAFPPSVETVEVSAQVEEIVDCPNSPDCVVYLPDEVVVDEEGNYSIIVHQEVNYE